MFLFSLYLDIPQIAILTKIDEKSCDLVKKDLKNVYSSTNIKNAVSSVSIIICTTAFDTVPIHSKVRTLKPLSRYINVFMNGT